MTPVSLYPAGDIYWLLEARALGQEPAGADPHHLYRVRLPLLPINFASLTDSCVIADRGCNQSLWSDDLHQADAVVASA